MSRDPLEKWSLQDAQDLYNIRNWGKGYFSINKRGCVAVHPYKDPEQSIDLKDLVDQLIQRGIELPILLRFTDILRHRIGEMHDAFTAAIADSGVDKSVFSEKSFTRLLTARFSTCGGARRTGAFAPRRALVIPASGDGQVIRRSTFREEFRFHARMPKDCTMSRYGKGMASRGTPT